MIHIPVGIISIIIGAFLLLFGYRLKKIAMTIIWFIIGYYIVGLFVDKIISEELWQIILCIVGGLVVSMFSMTIEKLAVFIAVAASFALGIMEAFGPATSWILPAIAIAIGVVAGVIATWFMKPMFIVATAVIGSRLVAAYGLNLIGGEAPKYYLIVFVALAIFGALFQWRNCKNIE